MSRLKLNNLDGCHETNVFCRTSFESLSSEPTILSLETISGDGLRLDDQPTKRLKLAPAQSFADVLHDMGINAESTESLSSVISLIILIHKVLLFTDR